MLIVQCQQTTTAAANYNYFDLRPTTAEDGRRQMTTDDESFIQRTQQAGDAVEGKAVSAEVVTSGYDAGVRLTPLSPSQPTLAAVTCATAATMPEASPFLGANVPDDEELKAVFYQADTDLSGEIDREELVE